MWFCAATISCCWLPTIFRNLQAALQEALIYSSLAVLISAVAAFLADWIGRRPVCRCVPSAVCHSSSCG
jgi:cyanate permease